NAHQLRPEVEPDGSVEDGATVGFAVLSTTLGTGTGLSPCLTRDRKRVVGVGNPKRKRSFLRKA
ncbi:hypothetical protein, partial [Parabacteroides sp.]